MIIYYQDSTKKIRAILNHKAKTHLDTQEKLEADMNVMFPEGDVGVSRFAEDKEAACGGIWDPVTQTQIAPPVNPTKPPHPHKDRLKELINKWAADPTKATTAEVAEYLVKADLTKKMTEVAVSP